MKDLKKRLFPVLVSLSLAACGGIIAEMHGIPIVNPNDAADVAAHTKVTYDPHKKQYSFSGPLIFAQRRIDGHSYLLRAWSDERHSERPIQAQIYVIAQLDDWAFLDTAHSEGTRLSLTQIDRGVVYCSRTNCTVSETVGINMTSAVFRTLASRDAFSFRISGRRGSVELSIPGSYFAGFLQGMRTNPVTKE